jgi:hypothetical protein
MKMAYTAANGIRGVCSVSRRVVGGELFVTRGRD